ncbi:MAG: laccase domain-containing protein [Bacteroidaceae bacterium]|nr:laccase domain-containing protein [Bacteroidaceae bacterium]
MLIHPTPNSLLAFSTTTDGQLEEPVTAPLLLPSHQVHGTSTYVIDQDFLQLTPLEQTLRLHAIDALCTDVPGICIGVKTADCIPILLYNESCTVVSAVHAGWKGTVQRIVEANICVLQNQYHTEPQQLHAIIGPGISLQSFEVGDEVYEQFQQAGFPMQQIAKRYAKWHIDLWEANRLQLLSKGLLPQNIHTCGIDTMTNERFFSARRLKNCPGRIINGILIKSNTAHTAHKKT